MDEIRNVRNATRKTYSYMLIASPGHHNKEVRRVLVVPRKRKNAAVAAFEI